MESFSFFDRQVIRDNMASNRYDLVIIGGGITGAGIALDAVSRGMKVALVEKNDFASGTSSKSTKLVHGGLRYLKQFHFMMVAEIGNERRIVHNIAPHLVLPEKMLLPVMKDSTMGKLTISMGLMIYDLFAGVKGADKRTMLSKRKTLAAEPLLPIDKTIGGGLYAEYRTDDARLTIEIIKTARSFGAEMLNYAEVEDFIYEEGEVKGVACFDHITRENFVILAKEVVNAAGPWVDDLRKLNHSYLDKRLHITKGIHLVFPHKKLPVNQSLYFEIGDGRMIFIIPRDEITYVGTTDTDYTGDRDNVQVTKQDAAYLIAAVNNLFPSINLNLNDVHSSWAGLRPLIAEEGKLVSEISRKDEIFVSLTGLISIAGGKLTGYRKMAEKVVDMIARKLKHEGYKKCNTASLPLKGNKFDNYLQVQEYIGEIKVRLKQLGLPEKYASYLVHNYGNQTDTILSEFEIQPGDDPHKKLLWAELYFCINNEMVCKPLDFFERRTGRLYFNLGSVKKNKEEILAFFKEKFSWSEEDFIQEKDLLDKICQNSGRFE
ncbi:MAG: glycerol-3-phosphate dehydrogenase/oxidase [Cyclobacteriaceae bacterium]|nr:glycerol-3-phosphate dehydrogenase/oxidase [Cyclobacteriaceae bacterium]